jgi:hypothetical protein
VAIRAVDDFKELAQDYALPGWVVEMVSAEVQTAAGKMGLNTTA